MEKKRKLKVGDTRIELVTAQKWVRRWKDPKECIEARKKVDSYLIPVQNLALLLAQGIDAARAYIGINDVGEQTLMFVGTKYDKTTGIYVDMIPGYKNSDEVCNTGESGIYDFSEPSPPHKGDDDSPMNK